MHLDKFRMFPPGYQQTLDAPRREVRLAHSGIMAVQAIRDVSERGHLIGDVPVLAIVGIVLIVLAPKSGETAGAT